MRDSHYNFVCICLRDVATMKESSSRPLSSVFQNIHPSSLWRSRKGQLSFNQVSHNLYINIFGLNISPLEHVLL